MRVPITVPELGGGTGPLRLGEWNVDLGDSVLAGECVAELICPGLAIELPAPASGVVVEFAKQPEQPLTCGEIVGWLEASSGAPE